MAGCALTTLHCELSGVLRKEFMQDSDSFIPTPSTCLFCCLSCLHGGYASVPCYARIVGGPFSTITCRQIRLAHSSVCQGSHTLAHPSDLRLGKGCEIPSLEGVWMYGVTAQIAVVTMANWSRCSRRQTRLFCTPYVLLHGTAQFMLYHQQRCRIALY